MLKQITINSAYTPDSGAEPVTINLHLPPSISAIGLKTIFVQAGYSNLLIGYTAFNIFFSILTIWGGASLLKTDHKSVK